MQLWIIWNFNVRSIFRISFNRLDLVILVPINCVWRERAGEGERNVWRDSFSSFCLFLSIIFAFCRLLFLWFSLFAHPDVGMSVCACARVCFARSLALKIHHADIWLHNHCRISSNLLICRYRTHRNVFHFYKFRAFSFHLTQKRSRIYAIIIAHTIHTHITPKTSHFTYTLECIWWMYARFWLELCF